MNNDSSLRRKIKQLGGSRSIAAAVFAALYGSAAVADPDSADESSIQEVVVTATRHTSSAQDLPMSITAVSGASLQAAGIQDIADLAQSMAGVSYTNKGPFSDVVGADLIIRGLNSETTSGPPAGASPIVPPVATYVNETPLLVNLRLQDLDRVEVLRGPQGTLYGSGSLGGTIRFVQNSPDLTAFDAKGEAGLSETDHTQRLNEDVNGILNLPLASTFAVRLNAGWTYDAGFINMPNLYALDAGGVPAPAQPGNLFSPPIIYDRQGVNSYEYRTARVAALWQPADSLRVELNYYNQLSTANGFPYVATNPAGYNQPINPENLPTGTFTNPPALTQLFSAPVPAGADRLSSPENHPDTTHDTVDLAALTVDYDLGFATMTSATSWAHHVNRTLADETATYENFPAFPQDIYGQNPRMLVLGHEVFDDKPWSEELRFASKSGVRFDWVGGLFFEHQYTVIQENDYYPGYSDFYSACEPIYGASPGDFVTPSYCGVGDTAYVPGQNTVINGIPVLKDGLFDGDFETTFKDLAAFGELIGHITSAWSLTGGARLFEQTVEQGQQSALLLLAAPQFDTPPTNLSSSNTWRRALWKVSTSYQLDPTNLIYATWSQGFRRGGVNALPAVAGGVTTPAALYKVAPDTVDNYELGIKGTIEKRFRYSLDVFKIQWHNIQEAVEMTPIVVPGVLNIGDGYSWGSELELEAVLTSHLSAHLGYTYDQTRLTTISPLYVFPIVDGTPPGVGSALPGTPKSSAVLGLDYGHIRLAGGELRFAADAHYQSSVLPALSSTVPQVPGYTMVDARTAFDLPHWTVMLYVDNVTNNLGITSFQDPAIYGNRYMAIVSQPRTYGFTVSYSFQER